MVAPFMVRLAASVEELSQGSQSNLMAPPRELVVQSLMALPSSMTRLPRATETAAPPLISAQFWMIAPRPRVSCVSLEPYTRMKAFFAVTASLLPSRMMFWKVSLPSSSRNTYSLLWVLSLGWKEAERNSL